MRFLNWLNRHLGKSEPVSNLQFDSYREDGNAKLDLVRLEDRIVLSVSAALGGMSSDVLQLNLDMANDEATVSVIDSGAKLQVDDGGGLPGSILQFDTSQINSILVTGTDSSQVINLLGQENLVIPGAMDLTNFTGNVNIGIYIVLGPGESPQFNSSSVVKYLGQFELTSGQLDVILPNELNVDDAFIIQINGPNLEILDPTNLANPLFSAPTASINSINVLGADGESDLLTLDYSTPGLVDIEITFDGGSDGNDALEFVGGTFDTVTHDLTGPGSGSVDFVDNGTTEISYVGLEPVFGVTSTANNIIINLPANIDDAVLENTAVPGEMQIRSLSAAFELTNFAMPVDSLTINTAGGSSVVVLDSFDATFAPANLILSGQPGDTYQLAASDLLADSVLLTLSGGATLDLGAFNETIAGFILEDGSVIATSGILSLQTNLELRSGTVSADLSGTGLIKNGTGTVVLNGTNTFTSSTAVQNGLLKVEGSLTTTQVVVSTGAALGGTGIIDASVTVNSGGHLEPGASPGIITTGDLTLGAGATLDVEIDGTQVGTEYDQIQVNGIVDVTGAFLNPISAFTAAAGNEFILIDNDGTMDAVIGKFDGYDEGALLTFNGNQVFISYQGGDGNDVVLTVNSPPAASNQTFDVDENSINTTAIGTIAATDTDLPPDSLTFSVTGGTGQFVFNVSPTGDITVADQNQLDFENTTTFDLDILVTDSAGETDTATITVNLNPLNDNDPVVLDQIRNIDENTTNGTSVGSVIAASDADLPGDTLTFSENGGTGTAAFDITGSGQIVVADQSLLNFETNPTYTLDIIVDDNAGATDTATITINLNDLAETMFVTPADWSVNDITLVREGSLLRVLETGTTNEIVPAHEFASVDNVVITGDASDNIVRLDYTGIITPLGGISFDGGVGSDTIVSLNLTNDWVIDGVNSGSLQSGSVTYSDVENLTGSVGDDTFVMLDGGRIDGLINALGGFDTLDFSADSNVVTVDIDTRSATTVNLAYSIDKIIGDNTQDRITGGTLSATYVIDGVNQGVINSLLEFDGFNHLTGAAGADLYQFTGAGQITGSIDGLAGNDTLDYSASTALLDLMLTTVGTNDGFAGSEALTVTAFDNINTIIGSSNSDSLTGINNAANWSLDGTDQYTSSNTLDFSEFENLAGGTNADTFDITGSQTHDLMGNSGDDLFQFQDGASLTGTIDGQSGADKLDYSLVSSSIDAALIANGSVDGFQGTETAISGGFDNINEILAGFGVADQLTGRDAAATWTIQPASIYGSVTSLGFSNFETLQGGSDVDIFNINGSHTLNLSGGLGADLFQFDNNGSSINGTIDGQEGDDHLNLTNYTENLSATLTSLGSVDGFAGNESTKSLVFENINQLTGGSGTNSLAGINDTADWTLEGTNSYQSTNTLGFSNFINLLGGTDSDSFNVTPDTEAFHIFGGNPASNPLGDQLNVDTSAAGTALVSSDGVGAGTITGSFPTITYTEIEDFAISGVVDVQVSGTINNDAIEILVVGPNVEYRLGGTLIGSSSLADTNHITVNGGDGDDSLTVDVALAAEGITIAYNGEGQVTTNPGDILKLLGTTNSVEYFFTDISSGSVRIGGAATDFIAYTGLEPITSTVTTADVTLNYSGVSETITITDAGGGQTTVNSTAGELLTFANPTNSLTINTGAGDDIIDINSLAASFSAALTINGDADTDTINANSTISFDAGKNLIFNAENINVDTGITITAVGIALNATEINLDGDLVSANVSGDATTVNVPGSLGGADIQDAVDVAGTGGIINVAAGSYLTSGTLTVDESVSILGADKDAVEIRKTGDPASNFDVAVSVSADNVTISGAQLGWDTHTAATDYQGYVVLTTADNTTLTNLLFSDNYRSAVVFVGADNLEVSDSIFEGKFGRAAIRDGSSGSGENFLITRNEFRADHFRWGPIAIGPQGTFGDPNNFAFSGEISFNYFGNGLEAGSFQEAGDQNYTITITNGGMTADGIDIIHNSFDWQDSATTNGNGIFAQPGGIFFDPALSVPIGTVNITDNIFNGFTYDGPQPTTEPLWNPTGGVFGGALEFDGVDDFGLFQDPLFDVGEAGTLSFWVNMDDTSRRNQFFEGPNNGGFEFQYRVSGGDGQFFGRVNGDYTIQAGPFDGPFPGGVEGVWSNIQYTWDSATGEMHIYLNGVEEPYLASFDENLSGFNSTNFVDTVNDLMNVGRDPSSGRFFDGLMDDVGWFNQVLNTAELATIRGAGGVANLSADGRLVAHWDFDESSGNIATDNKNGIEMLISTNGIVPFGPEFQPGAGQFGGALQFDGIDDFATFQDVSFDVGKQGTLNFWVQMEDTGRQNQFFEGPNDGGFEFQYRLKSGVGQFFGRTQNGADYTIQQGPFDGLPPGGVEGEWTNLQYTWDADTGEMHIYLNGVEEPYLSSYDENLAGFDSTHFTDTINGLMNVGRDPGDSSRYFEGLMDDIGWFNKVLNQTDRDAIRLGGVTALSGDAHLVAHWNLDDPAGTTIVSGDSGTNIDLFIQAIPPLPPIQGFGVLAPLNANVTYNAFNNNDLDSNVTLDSTNILGDPLYAYASNPAFMGTPSLEEQFAIGFGSSAAYTSSEFAGDTNTVLPHIGAYQGPPILFPGLFGEGDIVIFGTDEDDLLELTLTGKDTATFVLTRDVGGTGETVLGTVLLTDITSITFNGLGGDDLLILNQPDDLFFNPSGGIIFNGGTQNNDGNSSNTFAVTGDTLIINHSMPLEADSVAYVFTPDSVPAEGEDGVITITDASMDMDDGSTTITFTGLEPILDNLLVADRSFEFTDATEMISLSDDAVPGDMYSFIDSDLSESVLFLNPNNSITIQTDTGSPGADTVNIYSLDSSFDTSLTILADNDDSVIFQSTTNLVTGDLFVTASTVDILANIDAASVDISSSGIASTTFDGGTVTTTGSQLYNNAVNFVTNSTLTSSGGANIEFSSTIGGGVDLIIDTAGNTIFGGAVGSNTALTSLTTDADGGTQINGGSISTTADQIFLDDVLLGTDTILTSTATGNITFNETLNGAFTLDVNTDGLTNFNQAVGNSAALMSLTTNANGTTNINGGSIETTGNQTFNDDVSLGADTILTSTATSDITFNETLNGAFTLDVNTDGLTNFNKAVGNSAALNSLTTDTNGTTNINGGSINTTADQIFHDDVLLGAGTTLTSTDPGIIIFNKTLNGAVTLDVNTAGVTNFNGTVGNNAALISLSTDADGTTNINGGSINTTADQTYHDDVSLGVDTILTSTDPGNITFNKTLNGAVTLDVNTAGLTNFNGIVTLISLTTDAAGTTNINGGSIETTDNQTYNDDVSLGTDTTLTSTATGDITFNETLNGAFTLGVNTDDLTTFNKAVGNSAALMSLTTDANGTTNINGGSIETTGNQTYNDDVSLGADTILTSTATGDITFNETLNGAFTLDVNTDGLTNFNKAVGNSAALISLTTDANGTTNINGGSIETTGNQTFNDDVSLGADTILTSTAAGDVTFNETLNGAFTLNVNTDGLTNFNKAVGDTAALISLTTDANGTTNINGGSIETTDNQTYHDDVSLGSDTFLTSTATGDITFNETLNGAFTLNVNTDGLTNFNQAVGDTAALMSLTTDANGTTNINGGSIETTGNQTYNDDVLLGADTILTSTATSDITFNETLNGAFTLNVNTDGLTNFNQAVGNSAALMSLTTDANGTTNINGGTVDTTGNQTFNDDVVLGSNTTLTSTDPGNITFNKTLNGTFTLDVNTAGITTFTQQVGNNVTLASLTTNANGTTHINGGSVETTGSQTYHDAVTLGTSTIFTSTTTGDITFNSTLTGGSSIDIGISSTNNIILNAAVDTDGNVTATADSDLSGTGDMTMQVGSSLDAGSGTIDLDGANVTTRSVTTTNTSGTSVTLDATNGNVTTKNNGVNSRGDITITATGTVTLEDFGVNTGDGGGVVIQATGDISSTGTGIDTTLGTNAGGSIGVTSDTGKVDFTDGNILTGEGGNINVDTVTGFSALNSTFDTTHGTGSGSVEIKVSAGSNSITTGGVTVNGAGTILLTAKGATSDVIISSNLTSVDGSITLLADIDITLSSTTSIISQASGAITLTADNDGSNVGSITMDSGSTVESQGGQIILSAYDDIALSAISTTGGRVDITSTNGNITDNDITAAKNVTASQLVLNANTGIGEIADVIDTAISFLEADAGLGGFFLDNMGNLTVGGISLQDGIDAELEILVNVMGTLDITENVQSAIESVAFNATDELIVNLATTISTFGTGILLLTSDRNIKLNSGSNLNTVDGGISLIANNGGTETGDFIGVEAENATIETTGMGAISITGFGGDDIASNNHHGVHLHTGTTIDSSSSGADAGTITVIGTGGSGIDDNAGVRIDGASTNVTSVDGNIQITGDATAGDGIQIDNQGVVISTGTGVNAATISLNGTTTSNNAGVILTSNVQSTDANIFITGATTGGGAASNGVVIQNASGQVNSTDGSITIDGTSNGNDGIQISDNSSISVTGSGNIEFLGNSTGTGSGINFDATINSNTGTVTLTAEDDILLGSVALVDSTSGTVTVTADNAPGNNSNPITMTNGALIDAGSGDINLATDGTVLLGGLLTTGQVTIDSFSSAISDNGDDHTDIVASTAVLNAVTGIGDGNPLETDISTLSATVSGIGNIFIDNGIDVNLLDVSTFDGNITIIGTAATTPTSTITATSVVSTNNSNSDVNDITLTAIGTNSDILVTTITATGDADVILTADDGILDTNGADTNRITADNLMMTSSSTGGTQDGIDVDTSVNSVTAAVNTNAGGIHIDETDDVTLTQITTFDGFITINAGGTIQVLEVDSKNSSNSDVLNGIMLTATGGTSDIIITSLTAQNTADITLIADRDILDSDSSDDNITFGDHLTAIAVRNIGGITSIFTEAGFDPLQTTVDHMDLTSGNIIAIHNTGTAPELINLDAGTLSVGTTFVRATGGSLDASLTTGISNLQDDIGFVSDTSITVPSAPDALETANLRLDAPDIIDELGGNIDINAVNAILFNSASSETVEITAQQFDGTTTGGDFIIINDSPALELIDLDTDATALTGGTDTNISINSAGSVTVTNLVRVLETGTLSIETTNTDGDLILNQNILSDTGSVTLQTANDILFNGTNNLTSTSGSVMLTSDADNGAGGVFGGIRMSDGSFINAGDGAVTLMATDFIILSQIITTNATDFAIHLETKQSVIDGGDSTGEDLIANEVGARVTIVSATGVGRVAHINGAIETQVDQINITNQNFGDIQIIETDAIIIHDIIQSTADNINVIASDNIRLEGLIQTITGNVLLDSKASIIDQNDVLPGSLNIHAVNLDLNAITGIGIGDTLELSVDTLSADTSNEDILLHNTATTGVTTTSITTGTGDIELEQIGNKSLTVDLASTDDGNITISNEGDAQTDILTLTSITAGGTAPKITLSTIGFGDIVLGDISGLSGLISVTSAGNINDAVNDQGAPELDIDASSGSIILQALNGIGNNEIVELAAKDISINSTTGNIDVSNLSSLTTGAVTVSRLTSGLGTIDFEQTGGQNSTFEEISTTDSTITVLTDGSITFENPGILTNVVSTDGTGTIDITATGVSSSIQTNDGFITAGGTIDITAENSLIFGAEGDVSSANGNLTLLADSANRGAGGGGIMMSDGTIFNAGTGIVDLQAGDNISVGQLFTTTLSRLTSTTGGVVDAGDTGGADITADELAIRTAAGAGSTNPLETAVALLAATNSDSGSIQIHNDLGGGLLTISLVDGIDGITNAAGILGDIMISNASPLTVNAPVTNSSGGNIGLESTGPGDLILNSPIRAFGGNGNINLEAGDGVLDFNDTGIASDHSIAGTGVFSGHGESGVLFDPAMTLNSETGAIVDIPPDLSNIFTPQILATGDASVTGDFGRFTEENFFITIDWGDGTVETTNFSSPGSFLFTHNYVANPNIANPSAPIPIIVTMQGDLQFTFSDGSGNLDFTTETGFLETPGDGLATVAIDTTPQVPLLLFPPTVEILDATSNQLTVFTSQDTVSIESSINEANKNAERLVFLRILAPNGDVIENVVLQESDLDNLPKLFKSLPDGRYQLYLKEAGEERIRLLMDVDIRGGKATDVTEDKTTPAEVQNPANDNSTTQRQTENPNTLYATQNSFEETLNLLATIFTTDVDDTSNPNEFLLSDRFTIDSSSNGLQIDQNLFDTNSHQSEAEFKGMQDNSSEKVWSSAALLSGYFHGKSLLKKPAKQDEFEDAMGKYGRRLMNRHYNMFKRNQ